MNDYVKNNNNSAKSIITHDGGIAEYNIKRSPGGDLGDPDGSSRNFFSEILLNIFLSFHAWILHNGLLISTYSDEKRK